MRWRLFPVALLLSLILLLVSGASVVHRGTAKPTMLHVTRTVLPGWTVPPLDVTVRNATDVQRLYQAAYALPPVPQTEVMCPLDIGLIYHLDFFQGRVLIQTMDLHATGCTYVQLDQDAGDVATLTNSFRLLFIKTVGISALVPPIPDFSSP